VSKHNCDIIVISEFSFGTLSASLDSFCLTENLPWNRRILFFWTYRCNYLQFLQDHLPEYLKNILLNIRQRCWFQQDRALAHFHHDIRTFLDEQYPNHWIGQGGPVPWSRLQDHQIKSAGFFLLRLFEKYCLRECTDHQIRWWIE